jgi:hypothetical protein
VEIHQGIDIHAFVCSTIVSSCCDVAYSTWYFSKHLTSKQCGDEIADEMGQKIESWQFIGVYLLLGDSCYCNQRDALSIGYINCFPYLDQICIGHGRANRRKNNQRAWE